MMKPLIGRAADKLAVQEIVAVLQLLQLDVADVLVHHSIPQLVVTPSEETLRLERGTQMSKMTEVYDLRWKQRWTAEHEGYWIEIELRDDGKYHWSYAPAIGSIVQVIDYGEKSELWPAKMAAFKSLEAYLRKMQAETSTERAPERS